MAKQEFVSKDDIADPNYFVPMSALNPALKNAGQAVAVHTQQPLPLYAQQEQSMYMQQQHQRQPSAYSQPKRPESRPASNMEMWASARSSMVKNVWATAMYDFVGISSDELDLTAGQRLILVQQVDADWSAVTDSFGNLGLVPTNHLAF